MCKALAQGMITEISRHAARRGSQTIEPDLQDSAIREAYQAWHQQFDPYSEEKCMQADYASKEKKSTRPRTAVQRAEAESLAKLMLENAGNNRRECITNEEALRLLQTWNFSKNELRKNVILEGKSWVRSDTLGLFWPRACSPVITSVTMGHETFFRTLAGWAVSKLPRSVDRAKVV